MAIDVSWLRSWYRKTDQIRLRPACPSKATIHKSSENVYEYTESVVGDGVFSKVRMLRRRRDGEVFALKVFKSGLTSPMKIQAEFYVARGMRHRNIIETYDLLNFHGSQGLLMQYAPHCLLDLVTSSALKPGDTELYLGQLLAGTAHIHKVGFAHRDLKLENVVIGCDGQAKIVDFGSVCTIRPGRPTSTGSRPYMAPELFDLQAIYDPQLADLWALAIMYICMITCRFPWPVACLSNPAFAAYAAADRQVVETSSADSDNVIYTYPINAASSETRPLLRGMLRVQPANRIGVTRALEMASRLSVQWQNTWTSSTDTLVQ